MDKKGDLNITTEVLHKGQGKGKMKFNKKSTKDYQRVRKNSLGNTQIGQIVHSDSIPEKHLPQESQISDLSQGGTKSNQDLKKQTQEKESRVNGKCIVKVVIILAIVALISVLMGIYLSRKPEVISVSQSTTTKYKSWEEIERYFFNISGITYTGRVNEGRGAASLVHISSTYSPSRLLNEVTTINFTPYVGQSSDDVESNYRPYGYIDLFAERQGVTVRGLNPENRIYYIDYETMIQFASRTQSVTSRLLSEQFSGRILTETTQDYFIEVLAQEIAKLEGVSLDRIIVKKEEVWVGILNLETKEYTISTDLPQTTTQTNSNMTAQEKKNTAQGYYDNVLKVAIEEKKNQLQDYGTTIADYFGFSFDRYVDLLVSFEQTTTPFGSDEEVEEETDQTSSTNSTKKIHPRPPIIITKQYQAVYGSQPTRLKEAKTVDRNTFEEMLGCIDYNETTRVCSIDMWNDEDEPSIISESSRAKQGDFATRTRFRVSVKPLPTSEVVQEPYEIFDPEEMYNHDSDDSEPMDMSDYTPLFDNLQSSTEQSTGG